MTEKYKGLRIASVNGQGAEGCGVMRCSAELQLWAKKTGATVDFFSFDEKKYTRGNAHDMNIISFKAKDMKAIGQRLNDEYDIVMFMSYPHNKYDPTHCTSFFFDLYEKVQKPLKAVYIHEIHSLNIDKITYLVPIIVNADIVFHFDVDTWFSTTVDSLGLKKIKDRLFKYTLWMNFDDLDRYRQKYLGAKKHGLASMTRWSSLKNVDRSVKLMDILMKKDPSYECSVHGIERSIGAKFQILDMPEVTYVNNGSLVENGTGPVKVYGPVNRSLGLDVIAAHTFASSFFSLPKAPQNYGSRMEYTQIEIIGVGTIPVFDKHWAENNRLTSGNRYIDVPYSAIYTDGTDLEYVADKILEVGKNPAEMQRYLDSGYEMVKAEFDADTVIPDAIDLIKKVGKNQKQMTIDEICREFVNDDFAYEVSVLQKEGKLPVLGIGEFVDKEVHYLNEGKQVLVKKCNTEKKTYKKKVVANEKVKSLF